MLKTGGLADVVGALPGALAPLGVKMRTLLPGHPKVMEALPKDVKELATWPAWFGGPARLLAAQVGALDLIVLDAPHLYARIGNPYLDASGRDWPDNAQRYASLSYAAARIGWGELKGFLPDVLHVHDWQGALAPAYLHYLGQGKHRPTTVLTIHNLAFQGQFSSSIWPQLGLPDEAFSMNGLEYFGDVGYLKAGIQFADAITTVSPTYAHEIRTPRDGMGMDAMLRWRQSAVSGIVNGIDTDIWNPATDSLLAAKYTAQDLTPRLANKREIEKQFGLPPDDSSPLICMITRLTTQKGIDLVANALDAVVASGARLVILGSGDAALEGALRAGAERQPERVAVRIGYDEALSHLLQGGSDAILVPSRFEPCGLTQLYGLRYGCVPVVARVGGLADTVIDANDAALKADGGTGVAGVATGLQFGEVDEEGLLDAVRRTVRLYRQPKVWQQIQRNGMRADVGWQTSAAEYAALYRSLQGSPHGSQNPPRPKESKKAKS